MLRYQQEDGQRRRTQLQGLAALAIRHAILPSRAIGFGHAPGRRQRAEQNSESCWCPASQGLDVGKDVFSRVFVLCQDEQAHYDGHEESKVQDEG